MPRISSNSQPRNKGEWSKIYALGVTLASGRIDTRFVSTNEENYRVSGFAIETSSSQTRLIIEGSHIITAGRETERRDLKTERGWLAETCGQLLSEIKTEKSIGSFVSASGDSILRKLGIREEFRSNKRRDLLVVIRDLESGVDTPMSVFVKSWLGASPTLLNASNSSNFRYQIKAPRHKFQELIELELSPSQIVQFVIDHGWETRFVSMNVQLRENLDEIDPLLSEFIASAVFTSYSGINRNFENVVKQTVQLDLLRLGLSGLENRFKNACDQMLQAMCMGMTATKKATPSSNLKLGVIEVDKSGIPRLIEILSNAQFESFLYINSKFESPSRVKFKYGRLVDIEGQLFLDLNFQIRLK